MINVDWEESVSGCSVYLCDLDVSRDNIGSPMTSKSFCFVVQTASNARRFEIARCERDRVCHKLGL
jgi:hypothetical protein